MVEAHTQGRLRLSRAAVLVWRRYFLAERVHYDNLSSITYSDMYLKMERERGEKERDCEFLFPNVCQPTRRGRGR